MEEQKARLPIMPVSNKSPSKPIEAPNLYKTKYFSSAQTSLVDEDEEEKRNKDLKGIKLEGIMKEREYIGERKEEREEGVKRKSTLKEAKTEERVVKGTKPKQQTSQTIQPMKSILKQQNVGSQESLKREEKKEGNILEREVEPERRKRGRKVEDEGIEEEEEGSEEEDDYEEEEDEEEGEDEGRRRYYPYPYGRKINQELTMNQ